MKKFLFTAIFGLIVSACVGNNPSYPLLKHNAMGTIKNIENLSDRYRYTFATSKGYFDAYAIKRTFEVDENVEIFAKNGVIMSMRASNGLVASPKIRKKLGTQLPATEKISF